MTIVTYKRPRYIDLLGDPIHETTLNKHASSIDTRVLIFASAFQFLIAKDADKMGALIANIGNNSFNILGFRHVEQLAISKLFGRNAASSYMPNLCIDTAPDQQALFKSAAKYGITIKGMKILYGMGLSVFSIGLTGISATSAFKDVPLEDRLSIPASSAASLSTGICRTSRGLYRFNKLDQNEWAIINTPDKQEYLEKDLFKAPSMPKLWLPEPGTA